MTAEYKHVKGEKKLGLIDVQKYLVKQGRGKNEFEQRDKVQETRHAQFSLCTKTKIKDNNGPKKRKIKLQ